MTKERRETFVGRREGVQDRVAEFLVDRSARLIDRFDDEPYNADRLTPEQSRAAYGAVREDVLYLAERHAHYAAIDKLPPGVLHKGYLEDLARRELDWQEHKAENQRPISTVIPKINQGPEGPAGV